MVNKSSGKSIAGCVDSILEQCEILKRLMSMEDIISCKQAAYLLNCSQTTISRYISQGRLKKICRGTVVGVSKKAVLNLAK